MEHVRYAKEMQEQRRWMKINVHSSGYYVYSKVPRLPTNLVDAPKFSEDLHTGAGDLVVTSENLSVIPKGSFL